ncbi:hypothetical protein D9M71_632970 [compost metagenome]
MGRDVGVGADVDDVNPLRLHLEPFHDTCNEAFGNQRFTKADLIRHKETPSGVR